MANETNEVKIQVISTLTCSLSSIKKRSGEIVPFDVKKIFDAIKAAVAVTMEISDADIVKITQDVLKRLDKKYPDSVPDVESIQDVVVQTLMDAHAYKTAESYIIYRQKRAETRGNLVDAVSVIGDYVSEADWRVKENANIGYSIGGLILRSSERMTAEYWLSIYPKEVAEAHKAAAFHIHDLGWLTGYCAGWSLRELLYEGFNGVPGYLQCKPAKHMATAVSHMVNFLGLCKMNLLGPRHFHLLILILHHTFVWIIYRMQMLKTQCKHWCLIVLCHVVGEPRHHLLTLLSIGHVQKICVNNVHLWIKRWLILPMVICNLKWI